MVVSHLPFGPTAYFGLHNCVARHDIGAKGQIGTISEVHPNLIFDNFSTPLGQRFATVLKALFPVPKPTNKRTVTFANRSDYISLRCVAPSATVANCRCVAPSATYATAPARVVTGAHGQPCTAICDAAARHRPALILPRHLI